MVFSVPARPACTRTNENKLDIDNSGGIGDGKIDDRLVNLSSFTKKMNP